VLNITTFTNKRRQSACYLILSLCILLSACSTVTQKARQTAGQVANAPSRTASQAASQTVGQVAGPRAGQIAGQAAGQAVSIHQSKAVINASLSDESLTDESSSEQ